MLRSSTVEIQKSELINEMLPALDWLCRKVVAD